MVDGALPGDADLERAVAVCLGNPPAGRVEEKREAHPLARVDLIRIHPVRIHIGRRALPEALAGARPDAELRYVGKQPGGHSHSQRQINDLLVELAAAGRTVVRLKGGDPFVFGRGGEEAQALAAAGVGYEVVPGVTAGVAAPAYAGIPLTHRDHASLVTIATGHQARVGEEAVPPALPWAALAAPMTGECPSWGAGGAGVGWRSRPSRSASSREVSSMNDLSPCRSASRFLFKRHDLLGEAHVLFRPA